ncbi:MAG TPA: DUF5916 domain-containing protein [Bacteroidales bacterium]|jgi:hypothetical protein|nr:DUF5916 domain-containing protein [Bacteroidales bacterium]HQH25021.1 DUF5916 domain-containing protein [Bacteroidales bacterium]HQJ83506.1 DUF5916 domain-containing protein [Bacteroidales bacterium]
MDKPLFLTFIFSILFFSAELQSQQDMTVTSVSTDSHVTIDGYLDEASWQNATLITGFTQYEPLEGAESDFKTEVRVLFGKDDLYIGAMLYDSRENIENNLGRRDEYNRADWFLVSIDSYYSGRTAFTFAVNAAGVQLDGLQDDGRKVSSSEINPLLPPGLDVSWDAIWFSGVRISDEGWTAEMRIPYNMLRYKRKDPQTWGIYFLRRIPNSGEVSEWPYIPRYRRNNLVSAYGEIAGIHGIEPRRNIQIRPYILTGFGISENENRPGTAAYNFKYNAGGDIKIGIGPNVILDATIRPDFGQIEADPAVLNLTAFETLFPEKRPFFLEGADIYKFGIGFSRLYYSKRFGADEPIIAAMKLSGRTVKDLSFGLLGVTAGQGFSPVNNYALLRATQRIGNYSSAGGILTYYYSPAGRGRGWQSMTGGIDWDLRFKNNRYGFEGILAFSDRNSLVPGKDDQKGMMNSLVIRKRQGDIDGHVAFLMFTDQYNPNDMGWISFEQNWYQIWANGKYKIRGGKPFGKFQRGEIISDYSRRLSILEHYDMGSEVYIKPSFITNRFRQIKFGTTFFDLLGGYDIWETRGLGVWSKPRGIELSAEFASDDRKNWKISPKAFVRKYDNRASEYMVDFQGKIHAGTRLSVEANIKGSREDNKTAWASNETFLYDDNKWKIGNKSTSPDKLDLTDFTAFDDGGMLGGILSGVKEYQSGMYYVPVFGTRDTRAIDFTVRGSLTFTSKLSTQLYTQFFFAKGKYDNFSILTGPGTMPAFPVYPKNRDFNYKHLQSNFVARWEYRPGSAIYFVWTHSRNRDEESNPLSPWNDLLYRQSLREQISGLFRTFPGNSFTVKIDYAFH